MSKKLSKSNDTLHFIQESLEKIESLILNDSSYNNADTVKTGVSLSGKGAEFSAGVKIPLSKEEKIATVLVAIALVLINI